MILIQAATGESLETGERVALVVEGAKVISRQMKSAELIPSL